MYHSEENPKDLVRSNDRRFGIGASLRAPHRCQEAGSTRFVAPNVTSANFAEWRQRKIIALHARDHPGDEVMGDNLTPEQRSYCMSRVRGKDTFLERLVREELHRRGFRFRKHVKELPGRPDIVFPRERVAVFIDGDFWHGYRLPVWEKGLSEFWKRKIRGNRERDRKNFKNSERRTAE